MSRQKKRNMPVVRQMTFNDIPTIAQIELEVHSHPWTEGMFKDCFGADNAFHLGYNGFVLLTSKIIGYLIIQTILDECHILTIGVKKDGQHKGYATQLFNRWLNSEHLCRRILLEVSESNQPAINLYQKLGFCCISQRKNYYVSSDKKGLSSNALIFEKKL